MASLEAILARRRAATDEAQDRGDSHADDIVERGRSVKKSTPKDPVRHSSMRLWSFGPETGHKHPAGDCKHKDLG